MPHLLDPVPRQRRQQLVTMVLNMTADTILAPQEYERMLLDQFLEGDLTIDQVLECLELPAHE